MAQVRAFAVPGVKMCIPSGDHGPPHIHARRPGEWAAKVYILADRDQMIELLRPRDATIKATDRTAIIAGVEAHRPELLQEWQDCQAG